MKIANICAKGSAIAIRFIVFFGLSEESYSIMPYIYSKIGIPKVVTANTLLNNIEIYNTAMIQVCSLYLGWVSTSLYVTILVSFDVFFFRYSKTASLSSDWWVNLSIAVLASMNLYWDIRYMGVSHFTSKNIPAMKIMQKTMGSPIKYLQV